MNIATEEMYYKHLDGAIRKLDIVKFRDGGEVRYCDLEGVRIEIDRLIDWINQYFEPYLIEYFIPRLIEIKKKLPLLLEKEDDVLYIF